MIKKQVFDNNQVYKNIRDRFEGQIEKGIEKYGEPVSPAALNGLEWLEHTAEELTDALVYIECLKERMKQLNELK